MYQVLPGNSHNHGWKWNMGPCTIGGTHVPLFMIMGGRVYIIYIYYIYTYINLLLLKHVAKIAP